MFTIAHRLTTIRNATRIIVLTSDGIAEEGTHVELIAKGGEYAKLYSLYSTLQKTTRHDTGRVKGDFLLSLCFL